jgi:hypothetical protein
VHYLFGARFASSPKAFVAGITMVFQSFVGHSTDSGATWTCQIVPSALLALDFPIKEAGYAVGINGTIMNSIDH